MNRLITTLVLTILTLTLSCLPPGLVDEAKRIRDEAQELYENSHSLLSTNLGDAARLSYESVKIAFNQAGVLDPVAIRYVATESATLTARKAVTMLLESQASEIDRIFGVNHSEEVIAMLLSAYCFPALDDIIRKTVDWQINRRDPSFTGDTAAPDIAAIITSHLSGFSLTEALLAVKGFSTEKKTPAYFASVAMEKVDSRTYCATRNWMDHGMIYQYRVTPSGLEMKRGDSSWVTLDTPPFEGIPVSIAADNNRLLVLTDHHELWWYLPIGDQAQWSIDIMKAAVSFIGLKPVVGDQICDVILPVFIAVTDSIIARAATYPSLKKWFSSPSVDSSMIRYLKQRCSVLTEVALNVERFFLLADSGKTFTAHDYADWSSRAHKGGSWTNLLSWTKENDTLTRGTNIDIDKITDIAVGHWNSTVVTSYVLADGKLWYIDEEIIQPEWKPIEHWNAGWILLGQHDYKPLENSPYPLDSTSSINASNSVISVLKKSGQGTRLYWLRWDYHQRDDFIYWPLDWDEHGWHSIECPDTSISNFRISTIEGIDPRENGTVWSIPAPAFTLHEYLPENGYQGIFGDIPREMVSTYPVDLYVENTADSSVYHFSAERAEKVTSGKVTWKKVKE